MKLTTKNDLFKCYHDIFKTIGCKNIKMNEEINQLMEDNKIITEYSSNINQACYHSVIHYDNIHLMLMYNQNRKESYDYYVEKCKSNFLLYGIKSITIKMNQLPSILYQLQYQEITEYEKLIEEIKKMYLFFNDSDDEIIEIQLLMLIKRNSKNIKIENTNTIYYADTKKKKVDVASLFYCDQSLEFTKQQDLKKLLSSSFSENLKVFHKIKTFIQTMDDITQQKIMLFSSMVLFLLGLRLNNDIDVYIHTIDTDSKTKISDYFNSIKIIDYSIKGTQKWPTHWDEWLDKWANKCGACYFEEILGFQDYHYYFCGIKIISLDVDIQRRIVRERPASFTDLIMINKKLSRNITLPKIPSNNVRYVKLDELKEDEKEKYRISKHEYDSEKREYKIETKVDKNYFVNTILNYLKHRYEIEMTQDEINKLLKIKNENKIKIKIKKNSLKI